MSWSDTDKAFMRLAIDEAQKAADAGEVPVGAIVVVGGDVVAAGYNRSVSEHDPTAHAEIVALREAAAAGRNYRLPAARLYVTLEPCVMCLAAIAEARVSRVVFGAYDPKAGAAGSRYDLFSVLPLRFEINGGLHARECASILRDFFEARR